MPAPTYRYAPRHLPRPDLTPLAGVFLLLSFFGVLAYHPTGPRLGLVALHETPRTSCQSCFNVPAHTPLYVCLTASGNVSFAAADASLQAATLPRVNHGLSQPPLTELQLLACIQTGRLLSPSVTRLPARLYLVIDAEASSATVLRLLHLLQQHHFTQLYLVTHCRY